MEEIELLEIELKLFKDNLKRVKKFVKAQKKEKYAVWNSHVVGELKHRSISLKQRLTIINKITTRELLENK